MLKGFVRKISCYSYANITNFHMKSFALSITFIVRFTATRKWPILACHVNANLLNFTEKLKTAANEGFIQS